MRAAIALAVLTIGGGAAAQVTYPPAVTRSDVTAAVQASMPAPCPAPLPDTYGGSAGVQPGCMSKPDATRPAVIQATTVVTAADGTFSGAWPTPFTAPPTGRSATVDIMTASGAPYTCAFLVGGVTSTSFAGKCWQIVATTLPSSVTAVIGLVVSPVANAAGGLTVRVVGRQ